MKLKARTSHSQVSTIKVIKVPAMGATLLT